MSNFTKDSTREIIKNFAEEINKKKISGPKPTNWVINFRSNRKNGIESPVYEVPIDLLRYRKDNGRIASDVVSYEKTATRQLDESQIETQELLHKFLMAKDQEKKDVLLRSIRKDGQDEPAIITCDGFLINGNRRRMVFGELIKEDSTKYNSMKVVILPGNGDQGGPPTIREIELIENRYQLQQDGKSEYSGIDRAISIKRKMSFGITLEDQLRDDPSCAGLTEKEFKKKVAEFKKVYILPLERAEEYLKQLGRDEHYISVSTGPSDKEGRWQAFIDYSNFYNGVLQNKDAKVNAGILESEIGDIQDIVFKIIRKRKIDGKSRKLHQIIRDIPKLLKNEDAKSSLFELVNKVDWDLDPKHCVDQDGKEFDFKYIDRTWGEHNKETFAQHINKAYSYKDSKEEDESALSLLVAALNKLEHRNMRIDSIPKKALKDYCQTADKVIKATTILKEDAWNTYKGK